MKFLSTTRRSLMIAGLGLLATTAVIAPSSARAEFDLNVVQGSDVDTLDPAVSRSVPSQIVFSNIFNTLVKWKDPSLSEIVPDLAESWSGSEDGRTWTFKLRKGVNFSDGTPFNAEAVKFNLDRIVSPELGSPNRSQLGDIVEVKVVDPATVEIITKNPAPTLIEKLTQSFASMNSPTAVEKDGKSYSHNPVGTGPYILSEWMPGERVVLKRNPNYFGMAGKPDTITFRAVPEGSARVIELQTGNADIALNIQPEAADAIKNDGDTKLLVEPSSFQIFFELNTAKPPFNDPRVRLAVNYAVDRQGIIDKILQGYGKIPDGIFPEGVQGRVAQTPYPYDPDKAKALLDEAFPGGYQGKIVMWTPAGRYPKDKTVAEVVQSYLNQIGLNTEFKVWEWAAYQKTLYNSQPGEGTGKGSNAANMWLLGTGITEADYRVRRKFYTGDPSNLTGYSNPDIDKLLNDASVEMNYEKRMEDYGKLQDIAWNKAPNALTLFNGVQLVGTAKNISGLEIFSNELIRLDQVTKQ